MADSKKVRAWGHEQDPPLAKAPGTRGRLSLACVEAWDAAHPDDRYEETGPYIAVNPTGPRKKTATPVEASRSVVTGPMVQSVATHPGTESQPSAQAVEPQEQPLVSASVVEGEAAAGDPENTSEAGEFGGRGDAEERIVREPFEDPA